MSFWKKYEFIIIAAITLLFVYLVVFLNQKLNFLLGNELVVVLAPLEKSFRMHYGDLRVAGFNVSIDNVAYCKADCSYSFNDRSRNEIIDKGNFKIEKRRHFKKSYNLSVRRLGSGQDIYSFDVNCRSIRSFFCLTNSPQKFRSSLITVNYDLTETEKELKKILGKNVTALLKQLSEVDVMHQQVNQKYFELAHKVNLNNLSKKKIELNDVYDTTRISIENLRSLWYVENYVKLNRLFNQSFFETLNTIKNSIAILNKDIENIVGLHNTLLLRLNFLSDRLNELNNFAILFDNETLSKFNINVGKLNSLSSQIINNTFNSYDELIEPLENISLQQELIIENSKIPSETLFFNSDYYLTFENDLLCGLMQDCKENASVKSIFKNTKKFLDAYPNASQLIKNCNLLEGLNQKYSRIRNETLSLIADKNISFPSDDEFLSAANNFKDKRVREINNSYYKSFEKNMTSLVQLNYNQSFNFSLYLLSKIKIMDVTSEILNKCKMIGAAGKIIEMDIAPVNSSIKYNITSKIDTNLSDNPPICCVFNECKPCCRDDSCRNEPKTFPIIFLHGHSVASANSPEYSLDAFDKLQYKLQDDGYLNAGVLLYSKANETEKGVLGLSGKPVTVKVTYYYDIYRKEEEYLIVPTKSESIDTYALRLNDIVSVVMEKTGKPKVNIVAFSMGGLIARKYIQIFGDKHVDKLIAIGSPHKGISGAVAGLCPVLGESKECTDMQEGSLFLNKLNDPLLHPSSVKIFNIMGKGCLRNGKDGDGIVLAEQASLKGVIESQEFFVNGTCSGPFGQFHVDLLDVDKHPEVYRMISDILKK